MSDKAEEDLISLIAQEQRGFRRILFAGFGILFVLVAMSAVLGVYYYGVSRSLEATSQTLLRSAFDARLASDRQTNQVANLERQVRRTYDEFRSTSTGPTKPADTAPALEAASAYLRRDSHSIEDELAIDQPLEPFVKRHTIRVCFGKRANPRPVRPSMVRGPARA